MTTTDIPATGEARWKARSIGPIVRHNIEHPREEVDEIQLPIRPLAGTLAVVV